MLKWMAIAYLAAACGKSDQSNTKAEEPALTGTATPLPPSTASVEVPAGWKVDPPWDRGNDTTWFAIHAPDGYRRVTCETVRTTTYVSIDDMATNSQACGSSGEIKKKDTLPSGAWFVECSIPAPGGGTLVHVSTALVAGDKQVRCWFGASAAAADLLFITKSLRAAK
jgi:hypothetical protein